MTPEFAAAFDPALVEILALADRARGGRSGPPELEQARLRAALERAVARLGGGRTADGELAQYALAALADELLIADIKWSGQGWWENHKLEFAIFGSNNRANWFFERAEQAVGLASRDPLEVFTLAVVLGFRGMFRDQPALLDAWLKRHDQFVKVGQGRPVLPDAAPDLSGAPPLSGRVSLIWASLTLSLALACFVVTAGAAFWSRPGPSGQGAPNGRAGEPRSPRAPG